MIALVAALAALGAAVTAGLWSLRLVRGPAPADRVLAAHAIWTAGAIGAASLGVALEAPALFDAAIAFVLIDAALAIAAIKALRRNSFQPALTPLDGSAAP